MSTDLETTAPSSTTPSRNGAGPAGHATLHAALAAVQSELPTVNQSREVEVSTRSGGTYTYTYATLADVHAAVLPLLSKHGLSWTCIPDVPAGLLTGTLTHAETGDTLPPALWPLPDTRDPQAIGSAITYGRRYLLSAVVGVVTEDDDDGRRAQQQHQQQRDQQQTATAVDPRVRAADLVLEYVPHEHHAALWNAYQEGAASVDDLEEENVARVVRALSDKHSRQRVLEGVAATVNGDREEDDSEEEGGGTPAPAPDPEPDDAPAGDQQQHPDPEPEEDEEEPEPAAPTEDEPADPDHPGGATVVEALEHLYPHLSVADVGALLRHGEVVVDTGGGQSVTLRLPRQATGGVLAGFELVERLEQQHHDPMRQTVRGALASAGWDDDARQRLTDARAEGREDEDAPGSTGTGPSGGEEGEASTTGPEGGATPQEATEEPDGIAGRRRFHARYKRTMRELDELAPAKARKVRTEQANRELTDDDAWLAAPIQSIATLVANAERVLAAARRS